MERDSFIFYRSIYEAIEQLSEEEKLPAYKAVFSYALNGTSPQVKGGAGAIFTLVKPILDANNKRFENGKKGGEFGKKGGRKYPKETPKKPLTAATLTPNKDKDVDVDKDVDKDVDVDKIGAGAPSASSKFIAPTLLEIQNYCKERKNSVDAKKFYDYFTESGWVDSKGNKVKSWKQKIITWESHETERRASTTGGTGERIDYEAEE